MRILLLFTVLAARTSVLRAPHTHTHSDCAALNSVLPLYNGNENENKFPFGTSFYMPQCLLQQFHTHTHTSQAPSLAPPLSLSPSIALTHSLYFCPLLIAGYNAAIAPTPPTTTTSTVSPSNLLPYFDFDVPRNLTVTVGQTGFLHCRVERLGDKDVSII